MKILVVNAYPSNPKGDASFSAFLSNIKQTFAKQNVFFDPDFNIVVKNKDELDDYLYDEEHSYIRTTSAKAFDHLDMIFVEGDVNVLPWSPSMTKVLILLRMCIKTKKSLFASAFAMQALVYLVATNVESHIRIINGKGGRIEDIHDLNIDLSSLNHNDYFLDRVTGDLYSFNYDNDEWVPKMNIGIHHRRAAQDPNNSLGKYVLKTQNVQNRALKGNGAQFLTNTTEEFCQLKKLYSQHYSVQGLPLEFVIPSKNKWDIHRFNFVNPYKTFVVLAESQQTPQIIGFESHCIGTLFEVSKKYAPTIHILENFTYAKLREIKNDDCPKSIDIIHAVGLFKGIPNNYFKLSSRAQANHTKEMKDNNPISVLRDNAHGMKESMVRPHTNKIFHVGYTFTKHHDAPLIVSNNTVRKDLSIKASDQKKRNTTFLIRSSRPSDKENKTPNVHSLPNLDDKSVENTTFSQKKNLNRQLFLTEQGPDGIESEYQSILKDVHTPPKIIYTPPKVVGSLDSLDERPSKYAMPMPRSTKYTRPGSIRFTVPASEPAKMVTTTAEIATLMFPELSEDSLFTKDAWVPGQMSKRRSVSSNKKTIKVDSITSTKFFTNYKKFAGKDLDEGRAKPCVRTSGEYMSEHDRQRMEEKEADKKNLGPKFLRFAGKGTKPNFIPNYVNAPISDPVCTYEYRDIKKEKWIAGNMKLY